MLDSAALLVVCKGGREEPSQIKLSITVPPPLDEHNGQTRIEIVMEGLFLINCITESPSLASIYPAE